MAFDPTIKGPAADYDFPKNLFFMKIGISNETSEAQLLQNVGVDDKFEVDTLENIVKRYRVCKVIMIWEDFFF